MRFDNVYGASVRRRLLQLLQLVAPPDRARHSKAE
jgi:hypothetical protein